MWMALLINDSTDEWLPDRNGKHGEGVCAPALCRTYNE